MIRLVSRKLRIMRVNRAGASKMMAQEVRELLPTLKL